MKVFTLVVIGLLIYSLDVYCQTTTNYYQYNRAGVPQKVGYSETRPATSPFSSYTPAVDPYVYGMVGNELQRRYNTNLQSLNALVKTIWGIVEELSQ